MRLLLFLLLVAGTTNRLSACHALALMNPSVVATSTDIVINANSDPATYLCGPHTMQVELSTTGQFSGNPPPFASSQWWSFPWYQSTLDIPNYGPPLWQDDPVLEPYSTITIPFSMLCAGTTVYVRMREFVVGSNSAGPWTQSFIVNVPGTPPTITATATTVPSDCITCNGTASLSVNGGTLPYTFSWPNGDTTSSSSPYCIGNYIVYGHDAAGCPIAEQFVVGDSCLLDVKIESAFAFSLYPNPAQEFIAITMNEANAKTWVILDGLGKIIKQGITPNGLITFTINTEDLPTGIYYFRLISNETNSLTRLSVVH